jgi:LysM repeat protein
MVSKQVVAAARITAGLLVMSATLSACSSQHARESAAPAPAPISTPADNGQADMTATEAAIATSPSSEATSSAAPPDASIIKSTAPKSYVVKRGDTLWGIASLFLRDPWLWPEVWYINPQVANPHLIYPGDTLALAYGANGQPQIILQQGGAARMDPRLRSNPVDGAIPTIPYAAIAAFLSRPSLLTADQVKHAPYVLAFRDLHEVAGTGNELYIKNLANAPENARFSVVHVGDALRDPDDGKVVGYQGVYTGTALVSRSGELTKAVLIDTARETLRGDKVMPADTDVPTNFVPTAPRTNVKGRILAVVDGTVLIGQYQVVAINRGLRHGVVPGTVLAVDQIGETVRDTWSKGAGFVRTAPDFGSFAKKVQLPDERVGTIMVFKSFERVSYALVLGATDTIELQDVVHNP